MESASATERVGFAATPGNQRYAGYLLSGNPPPKSGIPLKDVGLFERYAESAEKATPLASPMHEILAERAKS